MNETTVSDNGLLSTFETVREKAFFFFKGGSAEVEEAEEEAGVEEINTEEKRERESRNASVTIKNNCVDLTSTAFGDQNK